MISRLDRLAGFEASSLLRIDRDLRQSHFDIVPRSRAVFADDRWIPKAHEECAQLLVSFVCQYQTFLADEKWGLRAATSNQVLPPNPLSDAEPGVWVREFATFRPNWGIAESKPSLAAKVE